MRKRWAGKAAYREIEVCGILWDEARLVVCVIVLVKQGHGGGVGASKGGEVRSALRGRVNGC